LSEENGEQQERAAELQRLLARTERTLDGCLLWLGPIDPTGYGRTSVHGELFYVHRRAWELARGQIPAGRFLDHLCRRRDCVNVEHLEPVTTAQNNRRSRSTKLRREQVEEIRRLRARGSRVKDLAAIYGVAPTTISMILHRRTWAPDTEMEQSEEAVF
jgi:hypothetical protein